MLATKNRVLSGILALLLVVGLSSCGEGDGPSSTVPGGSVVTEPVGS